MIDTEYVTVPGLLSAAECAELVKVVDDVLGPADPDDDYDRLRVRNGELSDLVRERLLLQTPGAPTVHHMWFYTRYRVGGHLEPHVDGTTTHGDRTSVATVLIYLNDDFEGGRTAFLRPDGSASDTVVPTAGSALVLQQDAYHCGEPVTRGVKYLLRTDLMG